MTNKGSASNAWRSIKKKIFSMEEAAEAAKLATPAKKTAKAPGSSTRKRKTPAKVIKSDSDGDDVIAETPTKKTRKRKTPAKAVKNEDDDGDATGDIPKEDGSVKATKKLRVKSEDEVDGDDELDGPHSQSDA